MAKVSKAQLKANHKWAANNKDKQRIYQYRSNAKHFILEMANTKDLDNFTDYINQRREKLDNDD